jgi:hypothetical protein
MLQQGGPENRQTAEATLQAQTHPGRTLVAVVVALAVLLAGLVSVSSAAAEPKGIFAVFKQCPTEVPGVSLCTDGLMTSGEFSIGTLRIPVENAVTLQIGDLPTGNPENKNEFFGLPAKNGETLSKAELNVPGGLYGMRVTATLELVASRKNPLIFNFSAFGREEGAALTLPLRLHLNNPLLGGSCYVGSEANPVQLHLTDGETYPPEGFESFHGTEGELGEVEENKKTAIRITEVSLVDNTFAVPGAEGCGSHDSLIDEKLKIPDKAGENTATLGGELNLAAASAVLASGSWTVTPSFAPPVPGGVPASGVTQSTATLNGTLETGEAPVDYYFEYGTTTGYGQIAPIPEQYTPITNETLPVSQPLRGLRPGTTYHYRLVAGSPTGIRVVGPDETFTTLPAPAPTAPPGGASGVGSATPGVTVPLGYLPPVVQQPAVRGPAALRTRPGSSGKATGPSSRHHKKRREGGRKHTRRRTRRTRRHRSRAKGHG